MLSHVLLLSYHALIVHVCVTTVLPYVTLGYYTTREYHKG
jgi:hypothetical protein